MNRSRTSSAVRTAVIAGLVVYLSGGLPGVLSSAFAAEAAAPAKPVVKTIAAGKPTYRPKDHVAWETKGRIVGVIKDSPGCIVQALDPKSKKVLMSVAVKQGGTAYELQWLEPGTYLLLVKAEGYEALDVHNLVVKAKNDLRLDLEF